MKLTLKQKIFADYYIQIGDATKAAKKVGYKAKNLNRIARFIKDYKIIL